MSLDTISLYPWMARLLFGYAKRKFYPFLGAMRFGDSWLLFTKRRTFSVYREPPK